MKTYNQNKAEKFIISRPESNRQGVIPFFALGVSILLLLTLMLIFWRLVAPWLAMVIFMGVGLILLWQSWQGRFQSHATNLSLLLALSIGANWPLLQNRMLITHDLDQWHLPLLVQFDSLIKQGAIFPRWGDVLNSGHGSPRLNFLPPAWRYAAEFFHLIGFSFADSFNAVLAFSAIASGYTMYLFVQSNFKLGLEHKRVGPAALLAGLAYIYFPYRMSETYQRGAIGEALFFPLAPLIMLVCFKFFTENITLYKWLKASALFGLSLLTYHIQILVIAIFGGLWLLYFFYVLQKHRHTVSQNSGILMGFSPWQGLKRWLALVGAVSFGLVLGAIFWLPALSETNFVMLSYLSQSLDVNLAYSAQNLTLFPHISPENYSTNWLGLNQIITGVGIGIYFLQTFSKRRSNQTWLQKQTIYLISAILFILLIQVPIFYIPFMKVNQFIPMEFPSRLLAFACLANACLIGLLPVILKGYKLNIVGVVLAVWLMFTALINLQVFYYPSNFDGNLSAAELRSNLPDEAYLPINFKPLWQELRASPSAETENYDQLMVNQIAKAPVGSPSATILNLQNGLNSFEMDIKVDQPTSITLPPMYYPFWRVYLVENNEKLELPTFASEGVPLLSVKITNPGDYKLVGQFVDGPLRTIANWSSFSGWVLVLLGLSGIKAYHLIKNPTTKKRKLIRVQRDRVTEKHG